MTATTEGLDFTAILSTEEVEIGSFLEMRKAVHCSIQERSQVERLLEDFSSVAKKLSSENRAETRRGVTLWVLGRVEDAVPILEATRASKERSYFLGVSYLEVGKTEGAVEHLKAALEADGGLLPARLALAEAEIKAGQFEKAEKLLDQLEKKLADSADYHYLRALLLDVQGFGEEAMDAYEKALEVEPGHARALFRMAHTLDRRGDDARALELYEQLRNLRPAHVNTMLNLGTLYEDRGDFERAAECYQAVLDYYPNHSRARLYLTDARAASSMFYDEDAARRESKLQQVLGQPVAEVSCSPRVRTAMQKLGIHTMGDLAGKSEEDFMSVPNFGRTSLREVKELLAARGLSLSSGDQPALAVGAATGAGSAGEGGDLHGRKLVDMEWSGRIAKVFQAMNLVTLGDLLGVTEADLMKNRNFGMTSIKEIRKKLVQFGVQMREE